MKINIEVSQKIQKEIELETPAYFSDGSRYSLITESSITQVGTEIMIVWERGNEYYNQHLKEILAGSEPRSKDDFRRAYDLFINKTNRIVSGLE